MDQQAVINQVLVSEEKQLLLSLDNQDIERDRSFIHFANKEKCKEFVEKNNIEPIYFCCSGQGIAVKPSLYEQLNNLKNN